MRMNRLFARTSSCAASHAWFSTTSSQGKRWVKRANRESAVEKALSKARALAQREDVAQASEGRQVIAQRITSVPQVQPPQELFNSSMKAVRRVQPRIDLKGENDVAKNLAARIMDTLMKEVSARLKQCVARFPTFEKLHPFEQSVLDLAVGAHNYRRILNNTESLRKKAVKVAKQYAVQASGAASPKLAQEASDTGTKAVEACLLTEGKGSMWELHELSKKMRKVPQMDTAVPMVALIGAPNVGKSSLVNVLSSGTPEICNYPFTTRSIKMGHFYVNGVRHQITDTPGLLYRGDKERNAMELLTVATLEHLPTAALFVMDLTEECGCSCQEQWQIRTELLARFPHKLWIDIVTKTDMLEEEIDAADELEASVPHRDVLPKDAVQMIHWLPHAIRVSSVTQEGIADLQQAVLDLMQSGTWAEQVDRMHTRDRTRLNDGEETDPQANMSTYSPV